MEGDDTVICLSDNEDDDENDVEYETDDNDDDDDEWNDEEVLKRVLELSKLDTGPHSSTHHSSQANDDLKKALEVSLQCEPLIKSSEPAPIIHQLSDDEDDDVFEDPVETSDESPELLKSSQVDKVPGDDGDTFKDPSDVHVSKVSPLLDSGHQKIGAVFADLANLEKGAENSDEEITLDSDNEDKLRPKASSVNLTISESESEKEDGESVIFETSSQKNATQDIGTNAATIDLCEDSNSCQYQAPDIERSKEQRSPEAAAPEPCESGSGDKTVNLSRLQSKLGGNITVTSVPSAAHSDQAEGPSEEDPPVHDPNPNSFPPHTASPTDPTISSTIPDVTPQVTHEEISVKMKNVFETNLQLHLSGEQMEACAAIRTKLFPHQRLALAWMVRR